MARGLSGGMKRRLMIARALVHEPRLLILDEPTAGVDIEIRRSMWEFLREINARGTTIILTTHYLEEAETLCRNIAIINGGLIAERDRMSTLLRKLQAETFVLNLREAVRSVPQVPGYEFELIDEHTLEVEVSKEQSLNEVFAKLIGAGHRRALHAQQGQPARRALHEAGRAQARRRERVAMSDAAAQVAAADSARSLRQARWIGFKTIIIREYGRIIRIWAQTIVPSAVTSALYFVIFGSLIGQRVGAHGRRALHAVHRARAHHDGRDHQLLRQRGVVVLRREVRQTRRGDAGRAAAQLDHRRWATSAAVWCAASLVGRRGHHRLADLHARCTVHHALVILARRGAHLGGVLARRLHQRACSPRTSTR